LPAPTTATASAGGVERGARLRVAVVPGHEVGGGVVAGEFLAGHAELAGERCARGDQHAVVSGTKVIGRDVTSVLGVAGKAHLRVGEDLRQDPGDRFDLVVVGGDTVADQTERGRQLVEDVDGHVRSLEQFRGGEDAGGACADDCDVDHDGLLPAQMRRSFWA
jgi:hypothetical protein